LSLKAQLKDFNNNPLDLDNLQDFKIQWDCYETVVPGSGPTTLSVNNLVKQTNEANFNT